jgi:hypothetical protein
MEIAWFVCCNFDLNTPDPFDEFSVQPFEMLLHRSMNFVET